MSVRYSRPGGQLSGTICWATGPIQAPAYQYTQYLITVILILFRTGQKERVYRTKDGFNNFILKFL
jgi:hypothetical protein